MIESKAIRLSSKISQGKGNIVSDMDGEKVMLSIHKGKYYNLGDMGGAIWDRIYTPVQVTELIKTLLEEYDVSQSVCEEQVISFLELLLKEDLIECN
ncbi:lasso peptide biosynthesis PqqD family chaperone [Ammoniphilus sp. YIM 78166]|uniref:lasso peptide biosynthesis PqqD family chaperone n=1 Tax=Ammoniphilus sp. YIM 78166 TaxID=1644106 RepID=UPI00106F77CC|nr:lasso peptide biosynthesis PqqD family chaperone [Ammoniphilus sp. YIM 78166]